MKLTTGILFLGMVAGTAWGRTRRHRKHAEHDEGGPAEESDGLRTQPCRLRREARLIRPTPSASQQPAAKQPVSKRVSSKPCRAARPRAQLRAQESAAQSSEIAVENQKKPAEAKSDAPKQINLAGRRDPFVSPVVNRSMLGSGCSTGKRCLAIDQINLKGVVKADSGMIAVVVNTLNKAYFLRENDPVFNGYVVKITGDSIIFKETVQDRLGKSFTREVTKKITTSAV